VFARARWRIRAEPACGEADADLVVPPVSRRPVHDRAAVRALLGVGDDDIVVLVSFGGVSRPGGLLEALGRAWPEVRFVAAGPSAALDDDPYALPATLAADHPGLVGGVDAVIGKLGYGTVAEVHAAGVPFLGFAREGFPESAWLERFVSRHMRALLVPAPQHGDTDWVARVGDVLALGRPSPARGSNGADAISRFLREVLPRRNRLGRDRP